MMKKNRGGFLKSLCLDGYNVIIGRFGKKVDLEGMHLMGPVHFKRGTIQNPLNVFNVVHMMVDIHVAVTDLVALLRIRLERSRKLFRLLGRRKTIEQMPEMSEHRLDPLRFPALDIQN
jgi:hypothetical protein